MSTEPVEKTDEICDDECDQQNDECHHVHPDPVVKLLALDGDGRAKTDVAAKQLDDAGHHADHHHHGEDAAAAVTLHQVAEVRQIAVLAQSVDEEEHGKDDPGEAERHGHVGELRTSRV